MGDAAHRLASYEDLFDLPDNVVGEIVNGRVVTHPRPAPAHAMASSLLGADVATPFGRGRGGPGGWLILDEPELHLGGHVLVPDLAGWRRERMPELPKTAWFELAPDWICEVLSPSTARIDRIEKMPIYAARGVAHAWLVDPDLRTLEVFENRSGQWLLVSTHQNDDRVRAAPFDAVELEIGGWWA
jgi:Uma2 family endonuclease